MQKKIYLLLFPLICLSITLFAQSGALKGKITDRETKEPLPFADVTVELNGTQVGGTATDFDGFYTIKPITPGKYTIKTKLLGYTPVEIQGVIVTADQNTFRDIEMSSSAIQKKAVEIIAISGPELLEKGKTSSGATKTREDIQESPTRDIGSMAAQSAAVFQADEGAELNIKGARSEGTYYYIDGVKVRGSYNLPKASIEQITTITGGIPAQYGDQVGGVINITTRGPSREFFGGVEMETSALMDPYGHNLLGLNYSGPLKLKYDSALKISKPVAGFFLAGEYQYDKDPDPSAVGAWRINPDTLKWLEENPLKPSPTGFGFVRNAEFITREDLEYIKVRQNVAQHALRLNGKLDFQPSSTTNLTFGGSMDYNTGHGYVNTYALYNPENNPQTINNAWRVFGRFTQRFNTPPPAAGSKTTPLVSNAFYTIQADYSKNTGTTQDDTHKGDVFKYGYLGKFHTYKTPSYDFQSDTVNGTILTGWYQSGFRDTAVTFEAADYNPIAAMYTTQVYQLNTEGAFQNLAEVSQMGGLINGTRSQDVYSLWLNTGREYNGYSYFDAEQYRLTASGSADIKKNHAIVVGLEYEQRVDRSYGISPVGLWTLMRQLANTKNSQLDLAHPQPVYDVNGIFQDTVKYDRLYTAGSTVGFYENVRNALGITDMKQWVDIDNQDISAYKTSLFTADEMLNNGAPYVAYYGYDYLGNKLKKKPSFDDFFTKKDANGNYIRNIAPFEPIYMAGYVQDMFSFYDLVFNVGLRVDRYDANQKVLKDKYLLYETKTAGEVTNFGAHPSNIGDNYVVYVNDVTSPTAILGYRNESTWYDAKGVEISDPSLLAKGTSSGRIAPYLVDPSNKNISPKVFKDFEPQNVYMPRIAFSFPISDVARFFAHYDVLSQRPTTAARLDPTEYLFLQSSAQSFLSNPDLKPMKTTEYELGFEQKLTKNTLFRLSAFYREIRDLIQVTNVNYAYPVSYLTYGNLDFGTVKGMSLSYDLRRIENIRLTASYTLQFADGTGSGASSGINLIAGGNPNLRIPLPLSYDQRHAFKVNCDFRYGSGKGDDRYNGPVWFGKNIFASTGANILFTAGSGTPYTKQANITEEAAFGISLRRELSGTINGSRLPWQYRIDAKIDRDIELHWGKEGEKKKSTYLNVYLQIQNLLNTKNVLAVYPATGNPNDDGYLADSYSQKAIQSQTYAQSFVDLYRVKVNEPSHYALPRRMRLGMSFNF